MSVWQFGSALLGMVLAFSAAWGEGGAPIYDVDAGPWKLEAEDYLWCVKGGVCDDPAASGGKVAKRSGHNYMLLDDLPFPRTSRPVTIYLRVRPEVVKERYTLLTTPNKHVANDVRRTRATLTPTKLGEWQWMQFPAVTWQTMGDSFAVQFVQQGFAGVGCDCLVISTRPDLSPAELAKAKPLSLAGPRAVVARTASPPVLDGRGDDACWRRTVACSDFLSVKSLTAAQARTSVRLCYDDRNLYALFTCEEPILNVAGQRRGEFLAKVAKRDGRVYADDSVVVLLDPANTGKQVFELAANALGTVADARCPGPELWESRDLKWNSGARAKGTIGEDVWSVEMAIPFADLGGTPKPGDAWQCCLGRLAKARKETTSWNLSQRGLHDPTSLGTLVFGGATPGVLLNAPANLQLGKNQLSVTLAAAEAPSGACLVVDTTAVQAKTRSRQYAFVAAPEKPAQITTTFEARAEGEVQLQYAVLDAATLIPWYASPTLTRIAKTSSAEVKLACDGPYELYLNDEVISRGPRAPAAGIKAPLQTGANVFALKIEQGTAAIRVEAPQSSFTAETWKAAAANAKDAVRAGLDDASWPAAKKIGQHPQLGPVVGEPGKSMVLRRTLLWEKTRIWPGPQPAFYLARGPAQHLTVRAEGLRGKRLDGWTTYLATPPEFEVIGSTGFYGRHSPGQPTFACTQLGVQQVGGSAMRVVKVTADKPLLSRRHYIMSEFEVFVRYREQAGEPKGTEAEFLYWSEANGGNITEPPQGFRVRLLPKLNGRQPKQLTFQLWGGWFSNMDDLALREEVLRCAQAAGFNDIVDNDRWTSDTARKYGLGMTASTNFQSWGLNLAPYLKQHPGDRLITFAGKPSDSLMCMSLLLGEGWPAVEQLLKERLDAIRPATVDIDYEYGPKNGPHSCYCPRCLAAFRQFAKIPAAVALEPATVDEKYRDQWVDFMARRVAQMFAKFRQSVHRLAPGTLFSAYSGYHVPDNPKIYGINWQYIGDLQACDRAGAGYGAPEPDIARTVKVLRGIPLLTGLLVTPYDRSSTSPLAPLSRAGVLRLLLAGSGGVLVYERCSFDGRCWQAVADVSRLAAAHEDVFLKGKPSVALPGFAITQAQTLRAGGVTLVCALNISGKPVEYSIRLPAEAGAGAEFYSGRKVAAGEQLTCRLEPGDAAVYVLRR